MLPIDRIKKIILNPKEEWPVIEQEITTPKELYVRYIVILAAIPAVCSFLGMWLVGITVPLLGKITLPFGSGLTSAIVQYGLSLALVWGLALIIDELAPKFGAEKNFIQSLKLVAYAMTPGYIAGVFNLIPSLAILSALAGIYGLYLLYLGLPVMKKPDPARVGTYFIVSLVLAIVASIILQVIVRQVVSPPVYPQAQFSKNATNAEVEAAKLMETSGNILKGLNEKLQEASKQK